MCRIYKNATYNIIFSKLFTNVLEIKLNSIDKSTFAGKMLFLRLERKLDQREFAKLLHVSSSSICYWENEDKRPPSYTRLKYISDILNIDYDFLANSSEYNNIK